MQKQFEKLKRVEYVKSEKEGALIPKLEGQNVTLGVFEQYIPEKIELLDGKICEGGKDLEKLFELILYNIGIEKAIKYAPKELWLEALEKMSEGQ